MKRKIDEIILGREWNFSDISNMKETITSIFQELYNNMTATEKLDIIWDTDVEFTGNFGEGFYKLLEISLTAEIAGRINELLKEATVSFNKENDSVSLNKVVKVNETPKEKKEVSIKETDEGVETRAGSVKVKRV
tara:strand:+ start:3712 stop:4116 length:405 start_codon:yes stop_codon:yes gene_type:complete